MILFKFNQSSLEWLNFYLSLDHSHLEIPLLISYIFIKKIYNFEVMSLLFQIEDIILINKQRLIAFKHLWSFLKFETKLKFPSILATSVTFYLPNFIPFLFPFPSFLSYSSSIAIFILPHSIHLFPSFYHPFDNWLLPLWIPALSTRTCAKDARDCRHPRLENSHVDFLIAYLHVPSFR